MATDLHPRGHHCQFILWKCHLEMILRGSLGGAAVRRLLLAQGAILEIRDRISRWAPCMEPASPSACVSASLSLSLCVTIMNE